ncbi:MAG: TIGR00282 family metallophosphoesterase [Verrucomicrobia bacterium]|nr:TIGR00282 family metallophosphoesterase [Verrucomicrobiota bacterium]
MRLLFIGDIVGEPGRRAIRVLVGRLRAEWEVEVVVANGENSAGGAGITKNTAAELLDAGVDVLTTGDHVWDFKEAAQLLETEPRVLRPLNYPPGAPGQGSTLLPLPSGVTLAVVNVQGRVFLPELDNPFLCLPAEVQRLRAVTPLIFVDLHAEATSEKIALARFLDGQVSAVIGTHTHVQTADDQILPGGTAYLTDAGFTGPHDSVLGRKVAPVIRRFTTNLPQRFEVASGRVRLQGALLDLDPASGCARSIRRVSESVPPEFPGTPSSL